LSFIESDPLADPVELGEKVTLMEQLSPAASVSGRIGQLSVSPNWEVTSMLVIARGEPPVFVSVTL
jgi:hypothetical protein